MEGFSHEEAAANFLALVANLEDGVLVHHKGVIAEVNPALLRLLGYSRDELVGKHVMRELFHPDDVPKIRDRQRQFEEARRTGITQHAIARMRHADGSYRETECMGMSIHRAGQPANLVFVRDTRGRREMERMVLLSERMASVMLAAGIAHELNNPLAYVLGNLNVAIEELHDTIGSSPPERMRDLLDAIREAQQGAERARRIVRGLKSFSRVETDEELVPLDLRAVVEMAINMTTNDLRHKAKLVRRYQDTPLVEADESRVLQVVVNLLVNACQALPAGRANDNTITLTLKFADGFAQLDVEDTGTGVPVENRERIFDPFFTTKPPNEGTGLGLAICQGIVVGYGGQLTYEDGSQGGALFRLRLPSTNRPSPAPQPAPRLETDPSRILVVDDEEFIGRAVKRMLRGHDVVVEQHATRALERIVQGERFDVILCDVMMPQVTGIEFYEQVCDIAPELCPRFVFMTGHVFQSRAREFLERIPNQSLDKPFDMRLLRQIVRSLTRR